MRVGFSHTVQLHGVGDAMVQEIDAQGLRCFGNSFDEAARKSRNVAAPKFGRSSTDGKKDPARDSESNDSTTRTAAVTDNG